MVPDLLVPVIVVAVFSTFMPLKPATNFSVSPTVNSSCRWYCSVLVLKAYSHCVSSGSLRNEVNDWVGPARFGSG